MFALSSAAAALVLLMAPTATMPAAKTAAAPVKSDAAQAKSPRLAPQARKAQMSVLLPAARGRYATQEGLTQLLARGVETQSEGNGVCPQNMVPIGRSYCVDMYEASLVEVMSDGSERPWSPFVRPAPEATVRAVSLAGVMPQGYISGVEARSACERSGKRLCKPQEWKNACMGPQKTIWGYGNQKQANRCNDHGRSAMQFYNKGLTDRPEDRWRWGASGNMMDPRLNQLEGTLAKTGDHADCTNEYGVFDMVGNLHEWVDDPAGTFQGGYYLDTHLNSDGCYYATTAHDMKHADYSTGFRCCADLETP